MVGHICPEFRPAAGPENDPIDDAVIGVQTSGHFLDFNSHCDTSSQAAAFMATEACSTSPPQDPNKLGAIFRCLGFFFPGERLQRR